MLSQGSCSTHRYTSGTAKTQKSCRQDGNSTWEDPNLDSNSPKHPCHSHAAIHQTLHQPSSEAFPAGQKGREFLKALSALVSYMTPNRAYSMHISTQGEDTQGETKSLSGPAFS